jgi:hypothetical protein
MRLIHTNFNNVLMHAETLGSSHTKVEQTVNVHVRTRWSPTIIGAEGEGGARCSDLKLGIKDLQNKKVGFGICFLLACHPTAHSRWLYRVPS